MSYGMDIGLLSRINENIMDDESKRIFSARLMYSMTGDVDYLSEPAGRFKNKVTADKRWEMFVPILGEKARANGLMLYGAGSFGEKILELTGDVSWKGIIDKSPSCDALKGIPVVSLDEYLKKDCCECIVISSKRYYEDIQADLKLCGIGQDRIIDGTVLYDLTEGAQYFDLEELPHSDVREIFLDVGCCDGMSSVGFMKWCDRNGYCYCFEPDENNIRLIEKVLSDKGVLLDEDYSLIRKGAWDKETELSFVSSGDHTSHVVESNVKSEALSAETIPVTTIDKAIGDKPVTFVKMDIEGSELRALHGAKNTIIRNKPKLAISVYHKPEDIWEIPEYIMELRPDYRFYLRHYSFDVYETVLYAI